MTCLYRFSLVALLIVLTSSNQDHDHHQGHHHEAPHGGTLVALGDEWAHLELLLDEHSGELTLYILDRDALNGVRVEHHDITLTVTIKDQDHEMILMAQANLFSGEKIGDSSQFAGQSPALKGVSEFEVTVHHLKIRGQLFENLSFPFPEGNEHHCGHGDHDDHKHHAGHDHD